MSCTLSSVRPVYFVKVLHCIRSGPGQNIQPWHLWSKWPTMIGQNSAVVYGKHRNSIISHIITIYNRNNFTNFTSFCRYYCSWISRSCSCSDMLVNLTHFAVFISSFFFIFSLSFSAPAFSEPCTAALQHGPLPA